MFQRICRRRHGRVPTSLMAVLTIVAGATAEAAPRQQPMARIAAATVTPSNQRPQAIEAAEPLLATVSLSQQRLAVWQGDRLIAETPISSGQEGHRTPKGVFSIIQKNRYHESNIYSGAPMPFMQRLTWSGIALHAGHLPGYPASHGCVRLPEAFAARLFGLSRMGMRVVVTDRLLTPAWITHASLPVPAFRAAPVVATASGLLTTAAIAAPASLSPLDAARLEQKQTSATLADATDDAARHQNLAAFAVDAHRHAAAEVARLESELLRQARAVEMAKRRHAGAASDEDRIQAEASLHVLEEQFAEIEHDLKSARAYEVETADEAMQTALATKSAFAARDEAEHRARIATRATEPISVFVSRKLRRVYVRQGFEPIAEATIDIAEEEAPIGTHVFTATTANGDGKALRWVALAVPDTAAGGTTAAEKALDRIALPAEIRALVEARAWVGASFIVSDHGPSNETGKGTDFVILTQ